MSESTPVRLARIEEKLDALSQRVERIEGKLDAAQEAIIAGRGAAALAREIVRILPIAAIVSAGVSLLMSALK